jgi:hypothetical protein
MIFAILLRSKTHVGWSLHSFALLDLTEDVAQFEGITIVFEPIWAFNIKPQNLHSITFTY